MAALAAVGLPNPPAFLPKMAVRAVKPNFKRQLEPPGGLVDPNAVTAAVMPVDLRAGEAIPGDDGYPVLSSADPALVPGAAAFEANNIPPEILADPAVQAVISSVALDHGFAAPVAAPVAAPTGTAAPLLPEDPELTEEPAPTRAVRPISDEEETLIEEQAEQDEEDFSATSSNTRGYMPARPTSTASRNGTDEDGKGEKDFGMKLSAKFGWTTLATLMAVYIVAL